MNKITYKDLTPPIVYVARDPGKLLQVMILKVQKNRMIQNVLIISLDCNIVDCLSINNAVFESVGIHLNINKNKYTILGVYRPPLSSLSDFISELHSVLKRINNNSIVRGDFNADICSDHRFLSVCDFKEIFSAEGYNSLIDIPTRESRNSSTCIDHIYVTSSLSNKSGVIKTSVTGHYIIFFCILPNTNNELNSIEPIYFIDNS